ncbi:type I restriction-modification system subunit M (plasmid) [Cyanobacterium sp. IPPAS B-1200]|uniref:class I SAM-dependent DNA methyltransferase n=1 Tax=Cyanobacterium sp. IPPAS B-1200 TaxID=1562720 RepID=UPI00085269CC|nr:class I SAM-dependent DNA methyltransferase [Cyanobacterium sp. IPPAS B-1200]OEJ80024.1 DNA methyltransferase [Cyanobacterium sp. IPPAS B-1200]
MPKKKQTANNSDTFEQKLWKTADKLRKNIDAAEYKHIVLGLIFLKYISDAFEELHQKLLLGEGVYEGADPEDKDEYVAENIFFVPPQARWSYIQGQAKQPTIGKIVDDAMELIERENSKRLKGILPKVYGQQKLDQASLGGLIDLIGSVTLGDAEAQAQDVLGRVYEYFLGQFALAEGKKGGQFYTPESIVRLLVEMLEPYSGRVFDPCCGSGGMFVQSEKFIQAHQGRLDDISIYGQESNETTYKLCRMNLAIRGIDGSNIKWNPEGSFLNDAHKDLKADFVIANPPFNDSDWSGDLLQNDGRWSYGAPPKGNANFAWVQHFLYHLAPTGSAGFVLSNGSLSSNTSGEGEIRKALVEADLVDCIVMLPTQLFYNTGIPACLWFMSRGKSNPHLNALPKGEEVRSRQGEVLFIDASELGYMVNRRNRAFDDEDVAKIVNTYHQWKKNPSPPTPLPEGEGSYRDVKGFCKSATLADIEKHNFVLTPGRYVGIPDEVDDGIPFEEKMEILTKELAMQMREGLALDEEIKLQLKKVGFALEVD